MTVVKCSFCKSEDGSKIARFASFLVIQEKDKKFYIYQEMGFDSYVKSLPITSTDDFKIALEKARLLQLGYNLACENEW